MKFFSFLILIVAISSIGHTQIRISKIEKLPLSRSNEWSNPIFSPNGKLIYFSTSSFNGIWEYDLATKSHRQVVTDPASGYNFSLSYDGKRIAYRRTRTEGINRVQEIIVKELSNRSAQVIGNGDNLSTPTFVGTTVVYIDNVTAKNLAALAPRTKPFVIGIENTKIAIVVDGAKRLLDPLERGSYIWPEVSPDGQSLVASDIARGTFVFALNGQGVVRIGKRNAATWTRSGKWLVYMHDKDDGHAIQSSDLFCISPDGKVVRQLTFTKNIIELNPKCSPVENKIVCNSFDGSIYVLLYEEGKK